MTTLKFHSREQTRTARARFVVAMLHLVALAGLLHIGPTAYGVDIFSVWQAVFASLLMTCCVAAAVLSPGRGWRRVRGIVLPCLSLPPWDEGKTHAWFPGLGWRSVDAVFREDVEKRFAIPMVGLALAVLPLFAVEHFYQPQIEGSPLLQGLLMAASGAVWAGFTFEFVVRCSIAEKKLAYVKQHWLDLAIILLPLVAFLRAARLARIAKVNQTARVFRLRGVTMRLWKAIVLFDLLERLLFRTPDKRRAHLEKKRDALLADVDTINAKIAKLPERQAA